MLKVAVIGVGKKGRRHVSEFVQIPGVQVAAVADFNESIARDVAKDFGVPKAYGDYRQLLAKENVDAVTVAVPPYLHREVVLAAAERKLHVHCEKPLALNLKDADEMISACRQANVMLFINFTQRMIEIFRTVHDLISSGNFGTPQWMLTWYFLPVDPEIWMPPSWFWRKELGGGLLMENGAHMFDYVRWIMGEVESLVADAKTLRFTESWPPYFDHPNIEDVASVMMRHKNGAMTVVCNSCIAPGNIGYSMEVVSGEYFFRLLRDRELIVERNGKVLFRTTYKTSKPLMTECAYFVRSLKGEIPPVTTGEDGRAAVELAVAAYRSIDLHQWVNLPLPTEK